MAQPQSPDTIFKALRLVPDFDGNPNILTRFIRICDQLVTQYMSTEPGSEFSNLCLLNGILNKITGTAACTINSNGIPDSWLGIRTALINNFSDQRDETALYNDLSLTTQGNKTPQEFYEHCQTLFSTIMTYVTLHETILTTIEAKRELYKKVTMQAFVRGLKEPLGSRIRCMRPPTIEKALEYVQEELNVMYLQSRNDSTKNQPTPKVNFTQPPLSFQPPRPQNNHLPGNWQAPMRQHSFRPPTHQFNQNRMPTNTQRMFAAPPPNYNPRSNVFKLQPRHGSPQAQGPQPMSGVQRFTTKELPPTNRMLAGHDWNKFGNPPPTNYFKSREVNLNDSTAYNDPYYGYSYYQEPDYTQYCDYSDNGFAHESAYDVTHYDMTANNQLHDDYQTQLGPSQTEQDFQEDMNSPKPR